MNEAKKMDEAMRIITETLAKVGDPSEAFPVSTTPRWNDWLEEMNDALAKLKTLTGFCKQSVDDPNRLGRYQDWKWGHIADRVQKMSDGTEMTIWNLLPEDIGRICVEHMDLVTKTNLRRTSTAEKKLVDATKTELDEVYLQIDDNLAMRLYDGSHSEMSTSTLPLSTVIESITFLMQSLKPSKTLCVAHLDYYSAKTDQTVYTNALMKLLPSCAPFKFENFNFSIKTDTTIPFYILQNHCGDIKKICITNDTLGPLYKKFFELPQFLKTPCIEWTFNDAMRMGGHDENFLIDIAQKWIEMDAPVGFIAHLDGIPDFSWNFAERFANRLIYHSMCAGAVGEVIFQVCIRMDDPSKNIVMREPAWGHRKRYCEVVAAGHVPWK